MCWVRLKLQAFDLPLSKHRALCSSPVTLANESIQCAIFLFSIACQKQRKYIISSRQHRDCLQVHCASQRVNHLLSSMVPLIRRQITHSPPSRCSHGLLVHSQNPIWIMQRSRIPFFYNTQSSFNLCTDPGCCAFFALILVFPTSAMVTAWWHQNWRVHSPFELNG